MYIYNFVNGLAVKCFPKQNLEISLRKFAKVQNITTLHLRFDNYGSWRYISLYTELEKNLFPFCTYNSLSSTNKIGVLLDWLYEIPKKE